MPQGLRFIYWTGGLALLAAFLFFYPAFVATPCFRQILWLIPDVLSWRALFGWAPLVLALVVYFRERARARRGEQGFTRSFRIGWTLAVIVWVVWSFFMGFTICPA